MERTRTRVSADDRLLKALDDVNLALAPLPEGYSVEPDTDKGNILVCCKYPEPEGLGFRITKQTIIDEQHIQVALHSFEGLVKAVQEAQANRGDEPSDGPEAHSVN